MGKYNKGILGSFSGKVGTVIGASWKGIDYMRSLAKPGSRTASNDQIIQRAKFALASTFLKPVSALLTIGFKNDASKQTPYNVATSLFLKNSITGVYPDLEVDYGNVLISRGPLSIPAGVQLSSPESGKLQLTWADNSAAGIAAGTDKALVMIFNPEQRKYQTETNGGTRGSGGQVLDVPAFMGAVAHVWLAFISQDGKTLSTSVYAGTVTIN
ncbi:hypothetical protein GS399_03200 [Pedobacter sp. HMF7647]|uniref:Uncharacterized protein n=1 Tax=Hufsiella arboris TaxID=2695275 RepID=A0A7K1Y5W4_9SPHI|nr:DUF6266 family protein [Hufsiella arboris]MXV49965.1 hypothetical protein [Hufsiella arboris]